MDYARTDSSFDRHAFVPYYLSAGGSDRPQRFVLDVDLFRDVYQSKGMWRASNVMRIPVVDEFRPDTGAMWIDARLFSDGYLRGNVKARNGEIQTIAVNVSADLAGTV